MKKTLLELKAEAAKIHGANAIKSPLLLSRLRTPRTGDKFVISEVQNQMLYVVVNKRSKIYGRVVYVARGFKDGKVRLCLANCNVGEAKQYKMCENSIRPVTLADLEKDNYNDLPNVGDECQGLDRYNITHAGKSYTSTPLGLVSTRTEVIADFHFKVIVTKFNNVPDNILNRPTTHAGCDKFFIKAFLGAAPKEINVIGAGVGVGRVAANDAPKPKKVRMPPVAPAPVEKPEPVEKPKGVFDVGAKVKISTKSKFYVDDNPTNPKDTIGTIVKVKKGAFGLSVKWPNGLTNSYNKEDLVLGD